MELAGFKVMKMGCQSCVKKVTAALRGVSGLDVVEVKPGSAVVRRDPTLAGDDRVIAALRAAGYEAYPEVRYADSNAGSPGTV
jgi:copper chaperone CopZ